MLPTRSAALLDAPTEPKSAAIIGLGLSHGLDTLRRKNRLMHPHALRPLRPMPNPKGRQMSSPTTQQINAARLDFIRIAERHGYRRAVSETREQHGADLFAALSASAKAEPPSGSPGGEATPEHLEAVEKFRALWEKFGG